MVNLRKVTKFGFGKLMIPETILKIKYREELQKLYEKLYFDNLNYNIITNLFFISILLTLIAYLLLYPQIYIYFSDYMSIDLWRFAIIFLTWFILNIFFYFATLLSYFFYIESKFKKIEEEIEKELPEFIDNLVSNLKGGISFERALLKSVRKEQKNLTREIALLNERILMGESIAAVISKFRQRFDSHVINRTFFLIAEGLSGGGDMAKPLTRISENLKRVYFLNEEIKGSAGGFAVVIRLITLLVAPLLFALALTLLTFIGSLFSLLSETQEELFTFSQIPPEFTAYLLTFSYAMLALITLFSSLIVSQLKNEKIYDAMKYLPFSIIIALFLFNFFSSLLLGFFGQVLA